MLGTAMRARMSCYEGPCAAQACAAAARLLGRCPRAYPIQPEAEAGAHLNHADASPLHHYRATHGHVSGVYMIDEETRYIFVGRLKLLPLAAPRTLIDLRHCQGNNLT